MVIMSLALLYKMNKRFLFLLTWMLLIACFIASPAKAQGDRVKRADKMFNDFAYMDAIKEYEAIARAGNTSEHICRQLAEAYRRTGNTEQSESWYRSLIDMGVNDPIVYYYYAQALKSNKKYAEADKWIAKFKGFEESDSRLKRELEAQKQRISIADSNNIAVVRLNINSTYLDYSPAYYGDKIVFSSARKRELGTNPTYAWDKQPFTDLYVADKAPNLQLSNVHPLSSALNSAYHEGPCTFNENYSTIYFTRNNLLKNKKIIKGKDATNNLKIYSATRIGDVWANIKEFKYNSDDYSSGHPSLTKDGTTMYFASNRPGGYGGTDIYVTKFIDGQWDEPVNLGPSINTEGNEMFPYIHPDGTLYFSSDGLVGFGGLDIFAAQKQADSTYTILNMGHPLNGPKDDFGLIMDEEVQTGYFSSNRKNGEGSDDIYAFKVKSPNLLLTSLKLDSNRVFKKDSTKRGRDTTQLVYDGKKIKLGDKIVLKNIYYDLDKWFIRPDAAVELNKLIRFMVMYPNAVVELSSHTDCRASFKYNMTLSQKRAESAADYVSTIGGIDKNRLIRKGYGETQLVNECADGVSCTEAQHQMNRRTEIVVLKK